MSMQKAASAFVKGYPTTRYISSNGFHSATTTTTQLHGMKALDPVTRSLCVSFFDGFKTPATLIAGTSFAALFAMGNNANDTSFLSKREIIFLRLYHVCTLISICLSLTTLLTSQAATTRLIGQNDMMAKNVMNAYEFLQKGSLNIEFLLTKWTFMTSILFFLKSTCFRMIVEFDLFSKRRKTAGVMVVSMMLAVITGMLSYINNASAHVAGCFQLWDMTKELCLIVWKHVYTERHPLQIASLSLFGIAILSLFKFMLPGSIEQDQLLDHDRYT